MAKIFQVFLEENEREFLLGLLVECAADLTTSAAHDWKEHGGSLLGDVALDKLQLVRRLVDKLQTSVEAASVGVAGQCQVEESA